MRLDRAGMALMTIGCDVIPTHDAILACSRQ
jgi:hypothetical protein